MSRRSIETARVAKGKEEIARELSGLSALERNPLLYPPHFESDEAMASFGYVVERMIEDLGGLPVDIETVLVLNPYNSEQFPRLVAKFNPKQISLSQFGQLEELAERMYPTKVSSTKNRDGSMTASVLSAAAGSALILVFDFRVLTFSIADSRRGTIF